MSGVARFARQRAKRNSQNVAARRRVRHRRLLPSPLETEATRKSRNRVRRVDIVAGDGSNFGIKSFDVAQADEGKRVGADRVHHDVLQSEARTSDKFEPFGMRTSR